jgi:hypothetical protein
VRDNEGPVGLIMAPARELAFQIYNEAKKYSKALGFRVACVYGFFFFFIFLDFYNNYFYLFTQ